jgi:myo-inositol-1-phosphate synthase
MAEPITPARHTTEERGRSKVRVAIIGAGNCASALVQGVSYYRHAADDDLVPGRLAQMKEKVCAMIVGDRL